MLGGLVKGERADSSRQLVVMVWVALLDTSQVMMMIEHGPGLQIYLRPYLRQLQELLDYCFIEAPKPPLSLGCRKEYSRH